MTTDVLTNNATNQNLPTDPLFSEQWHLLNTIPGFLDLNVVDVWEDYTGKNINVAVIDDAVEERHPDLIDNYSENKSLDFEDGDGDASPSTWGINPIDRRPFDSHGTAVAGVIGATANNGIGGVGVAFDSTITGFKTSTFQHIANAIDTVNIPYGTSGIDFNIDIFNISLGNQDDSFFEVRADYAAINQSIDAATQFGRDGLGTVIVKSGGNARPEKQDTNTLSNQDTNTSSWNANYKTISVGAVEQNGFVSNYSTPGASLLVSAFGTPGEVITTDRTGAEGDNWTDSLGNTFISDFTNTFNGTSAAAPMVSGVVALMLEANHNLGWRDAQEILAYSARHVGSEVEVATDGFGNNSWPFSDANDWITGLSEPEIFEEYDWAFNGANNWNGGGLHFSNDYGFGLVDAKAAVRLAETWGSDSQKSSNAEAISQDFLDGQVQLSDWGVSSSQVVTDSLDIEHVEVNVSFVEWANHGDLEMRLISPSGTSSILIEQNGNSNDFVRNINPGQWTFVSNEFRGEDTAGTWTVELFDMDNPVSSPIVIDDIDITFRGQAASLDDTFIFTEEYSDYASGFFGHSQVIDGGFGIDTINAAAVDSNTVINLELGTGQIDGMAVNIVGVEDVFSGDGDDELVGNHLRNNLSGMRGSDLLIGGAGNDILDGGKGDDVLIGVEPSDWEAGSGEYDTLTGGRGADTFVLGDAYEAFYAVAGYALITDFSRLEGDLLTLHGNLSDYSLGYGDWAGGLAQDTLIYHQNDVIGLVQDNTSLNLAVDTVMV